MSFLLEQWQALPDYVRSTVLPRPRTWPRWSAAPR